MGDNGCRANSGHSPEVFEASIGNGREGYYVVRLFEDATVVWSFEAGDPDDVVEASASAAKVSGHAPRKASGAPSTTSCPDAPKLAMMEVSAKPATR